MKKLLILWVVSAFMISLGATPSQRYFPVVFNHNVEKWVEHYKKRPQEMKTLSAKGAPFRPFIESILKRYELPKALFYLPMIESRYEVKASSSMRAQGIWQLTPSTAKSLGLVVSQKRDDRERVLLSTKAAAKYLLSLYKDFGSWELTLAAYNLGPSKLKRIMKEQRVKNYWALVERGALPKETGNYVAKLMAITFLSSNASEFVKQKVL